MARAEGRGPVRPGVPTLSSEGHIAPSSQSPLLPTETHCSSPLPQPLQTVPPRPPPPLTWWGTGSLDRGLRPSSGVLAMAAAAAAMAEEAARGSTGRSGLCSCFTMTEHSLCPSTQAPCSMSAGRGRTQAQRTPRAEGSAPSYPLGAVLDWTEQGC